MNKHTLDLDPKGFEELLDKSSQMVLRQFEDLAHRKGYHHYPQPTVEAWFDEALPEEGMDVDQLLKEVEQKVLNTATGNIGPHMYAYVMAGGTQISIIAEKLAATVNQNVAKWHLAPAMSEIEKRVVKWTAELLAYPGFGGVMVSGGSAANLAGLTVARNVFFQQLNIRKKGLFGQAPFTVYASKEVHGCVDKSLDVLGIGIDQLRRIDTLPDFTIDLNALEQQIIKDQEAGFHPFCIIGNAGTVNTGAIDDLDALATLADKYQLWFHVDGAYGGLVASLANLRPLYKGLERADSIALDFHKWLYQPFEAGCLLVKDWTTLKRAYFKQADYLDTSLEVGNDRLDFNEHYFQLSRNTKAFKVWMSMKAYGLKRIKEMIQKDLDLTDYLADLIRASSDFELKATSDLAIACFCYTGTYTQASEIAAINQQLIPALEADGRLFITGTRLNGEFVLRACLINHRKTKESTAFLLEVIREVASTIKLEVTV